MMIFHPEQTSWASQWEESIDLPGSNHNTSTFPQVYFLAFYQDFINYFRWQIDLLLCPSLARCLSLLREGKLDCQRVRAYVNVCSSVHECLCVVCFGGIICHLASKYRGHMVGKQMSLVRPANAKSRQMTSGEAHTVNAQTNKAASESSPLLTPCSPSVSCNDDDDDLGIKAYPGSTENLRIFDFAACAL